MLDLRLDAIILKKLTYDLEMELFIEDKAKTTTSLEGRMLCVPKLEAKLYDEVKAGTGLNRQA